MKQLKKSLAYVLAFITVFSSFTILPSEFWGLADVSAVDLQAEASTVVETNQDQITVEESATVETSNNEIAIKKTIAVETNKDEITVAESNAGETYTEGDFTFSIINDNEVRLLRYNGTSVNVVIPDVTTGSECPELANKKVTAIGDNAFYENTTITTLTLPNSLKTIGSKAFYGCTQLTNLDIASNLTKIGSSAFNNCASLCYVNIKNGKNTVIDSKAFYKCNGMTSVIIGDGVKSIGGYAFSACNALKTITIGKDCTSIATTAFADNPVLEIITISEQNTKYISDDGVWLNKEKTEILLYPKARSGAYTIPNTVTAIKENQFKNCKVLEDIIIGDSVENIGKYAFQGCSQLSRVFFGKNLKCIEDKAFYNDKEIETIDLSVCTNLTTIGSSAFYGNTNVSLLLLPNSLEVISDKAFYGCKNISNLVTKNNITSIGEFAFSECGNIKNINIKGGNNAVINADAFSECISLKNLTIGNGVKSIGERAFNNCYALVSIVIEDTVTTIDTKAFTGLKYINDIRIGRGITSIASGAFNISDGKKFKSVQIIGKDLTYFSRGVLTSSDYTIYCYADSTTFKTLVNAGYSYRIDFFKDIYPVNIKVNGNYLNNFDARNREYVAYVDDIKNVDIVPLFNDKYYSYEISATDNIYSVDIFNEKNIYSGTYTITVKEKVPEVKHAVTGDVNLLLNNISFTKVSGSIALPTGTYKLKIAKDQQQFGYNKIVTDYCGGITLNEKFTSSITLNATGGIYTFLFDTTTNKLVIKHDKNLPNEYLIGGLSTILKPAGNRPLSIGTQQLPAGTYKFKLSIGGKEYGYNKIVDDATAGSLSLSSSYSSQIILNATGGMYTFILNTETNKLIIRHTPTDNETTTDVHISGTFNLVLNDKSATGEELTTATGTTTLTNGCYTFRVYNYGTVYTASAVINDKATKNLSNKYTTPVTLNATGGTYKFTFNKVTGALIVSKI